MSDKEAFEKWWMSGFAGMSDTDVIKYRDTGKQSTFNGWNAAIAHEREKSKKLVECLEKIHKRMSLSYYNFDPRVKEVADVLKEYGGEK